MERDTLYNGIRNYSDTDVKEIEGSPLLTTTTQTINLSNTSYQQKACDSAAKETIIKEDIRTLD